MNALNSVISRVGRAAFLVAAFMPALLGTVFAKGPARPIDETQPLHVMVDIPVAIRPMQASLWTEEDFARVLGGYLRDEFRKAGYKGEMMVHERWTDVPEHVQRLEVNLIRWNRSRGGSLECTLTAEVVGPDGARIQSGVVSETQLEWSRNVHGLAEALEHVARKAMKEVHRRFCPTPETR
jgi:hypothetical protein